MMARRRTAALALAAVLFAACGQNGQIVDAGSAPTRQPADPPPSSAPVRPTPQPPAAPDGSTPAAGDDGGNGDQGDAGTAAQERTTVTIYFARGERVAPVTRRVRRVPRIGSAAIERLLAGPTAGEIAAGYTTQIPEGTRLRGLTITDGVAVVDFSGEFESGGGTLALTLRLGQVACTLDAFPTVDGVRFALDGEVVDVFSGDGLVVDEPVACSDYTEIPGGGAGGGDPGGGDPSPPPVVEPS